MLCFLTVLRGCLSVSRCFSFSCSLERGQNHCQITIAHHFNRLADLSEQECVFVLRDGVRERESYHHMASTKQTRRVTRRRSDTLLHILETLPGAVFVVDDADTIVYANASAQ